GMLNVAVSASAPPVSAAQTLFGAEADQLRADVEKLWQKDILPQWQARHGKANALSDRLSAVEKIVAQNSADTENLWEKAARLADLKGHEGAEPLLRQILSIRPNHVPANFHLGRILLQKGADDGETFLEQAMAEDDDIVPQSCALLTQHFRRT